MRRLAGLGAVLIAFLTVAGCPSAYQRTYDQETQKLEAQRRADVQQAEAEHAQASKFAAVVYFVVGSAALDDDTTHQLQWFAQKMQPYPQARILVQGFTDSTGSEANNVALSSERAANVTNYLVAQGIAASRITTQGFGSNYAAASNVDARGRRNNRRVEVTVR